MYDQTVDNRENVVNSALDKIEQDIKTQNFNGLATLIDKIDPEIMMEYLMTK